jgi:hypothetical protein
MQDLTNNVQMKSILDVKKNWFKTLTV